MKKSVVVIGAGTSGLTTIKACLEEGLQVQAYEVTQNVGGLWNVKRQRQPEDMELNTVHHCTFLNSSKEISAFSDFPPADHYPNYMHHSQAREYMEAYAMRFDLLKHIKFRHKVLKVVPSKDTEKLKWTVQIQNLVTSETFQQEFDCVVICNGLLGQAYRPDLKGLSKFKGDVMHSVEYFNNEKFNGKKVAVIGIGNSAGDIAVDVCNVASKMYVSTRSGTWIFRRSGEQGLPNDLGILRRITLNVTNYLPRSFVNTLLERRLNTSLNHELYGLKPKYRPLEHGPTVNDELPLKILNGSVLLKKDVVEIFENGVLFKGDQSVTELDVIILCTGFTPRVPFLEIPTEELWTRESVHLYKKVFPPKYGHGTLAFIGYFAAFGPNFPMVEMQSRWFASITAGKLNLPSVCEMEQDILSAQRLNKKNFPGGMSSRESWYHDYLPYMDCLAVKLGVKPNLKLMLIKDPVLFYYVFFGPLLAYQYRLEGPRSWPGARDAIVNYYSRVVKPFAL